LLKIKQENISIEISHKRQSGQKWRKKMPLISMIKGIKTNVIKNAFNGKLIWREFS